MSKSFVGVIISACISGCIAGGAIAAYGVLHHMDARPFFNLSESQMAIVATLISVLALAMATLVVRWIPDNKTMPLEDALLSIVAGVASLALVALTFGMMKFTSSVHQLWLVPAISASVCAGLVALLPIGLGLGSLSSWVPDQSTAKSR